MRQSSIRSDNSDVHSRRRSHPRRGLADAEVLAAEIRADIARSELANHERQLEDSRRVRDFLEDKFTSDQLYLWMIGEIQTIYYQAYQLAFEMARRAERAYQFERGDTNTGFIQFGHWDGQHKGLLAGEKLTLDLRRMDMAYVESDRRDYELTRNISLAQLRPLELIALRETGVATIDLRESLFDSDYPGHYFRRIKSVSLTVPGVTGPHTSVNCTLTLLKSRIRKESIAGSSYPESEDFNDSRFLYNFTSIESVCTSSGLNDAGVFELSFRDERLVPFEGAGAVSTWRLEIPQDTNRFDPRSITDAVMHLQYTAREGGGLLRAAARATIRETVIPRAWRLISAKHELASDWEKLETELDAQGNQVLTLSLDDKIPFIPGTGPVRLRELYASFDVVRVPAAAAAVDAQILIGAPPAHDVVLRDASMPSGLVDLKIDPVDLTGQSVVITIAQATILSLPQELTEVYPPGSTTLRLKPDVFQDLFIILDLERDPAVGG
jgi:hypothetical protein